MVWSFFGGQDPNPPSKGRLPTRVYGPLPRISLRVCPSCAFTLSGSVPCLKFPRYVERTIVKNFLINTLINDCIDLLLTNLFIGTLKRVSFCEGIGIHNLKLQL